MRKTIWLDDKNCIDELVACEHELIDRVKRIDDAEIAEAGTDFLEIKNLAEEYTRIINKWKKENLRSFESGEKAVERLNKEIDTRVNTLLRKVEQSFKKYYGIIDSAFFIQEHNQIKVRAVRKKLNFFVNLYSKLAETGSRTNNLINKYGECIGFMQGFDSEIKRIAERVGCIQSREEILILQYELKDAKDAYLSAVQKIRPVRVLSYHKPFDYEEYFKEVQVVGDELRKIFSNYDLITNYKKTILIDIERINVACSDIEKLISTQDSTKISCENLCAINSIGDIGFKTNSALEKDYPISVGKIHSERENALFRFNNKKAQLKNKINKALVREFDACVLLSAPQSLAELPLFISMLKPLYVLDLQEKFKASGNLEYIVKCNELVSRIKEEKKYFSEILSVNSQLVQDCGRISESVENANSLLSKIQNKGVDETALVNVRNLVNSGFNSGRYANHSDDPYLMQAVKKYGEKVRDYESARDSLFETALHKINADVADLKGADIARLDHALSLFEILSNVKEPSQKIREKISQLAELREELKTEQKKSSAPEHLQAAPVYSSATYSPATHCAEHFVPSVLPAQTPDFTEFYSGSSAPAQSSLDSIVKSYEINTRSGQDLHSFVSSKELPDKYFPVWAIFNTARGGTDWKMRLKNLERTFAQLHPPATKSELECVLTLKSLLERDTKIGILAPFVRKYSSYRHTVCRVLDSLGKHISGSNYCMATKTL